MNHDESTPPAVPYDPSSITRPVRELLTYYTLVSALTLIAFPIVFLVHFIKFRTLEYRFDDKGIAMSWGYLFRNEIYLTYRRIQDIHVTRNLFHRWLGLAVVSIQTASGSSGAEMTLEGIPDPERMRDYLYSQMRGARGNEGDPAMSDAPDGDSTEDEALVLLREIRDALRANQTKAEDES